jgi:hypothetical protein
MTYSQRSHATALWLLSFLALAPLSGCAEDPAASTSTEPSKEEDEPTDDETDKKPASENTTPKPTVKLDAGNSTPKPAEPAPRPDAGTAISTMRDATVSTPPSSGDAGSPLDVFAPGDRTPNKDNAKECPAVAPENPIGDCIGVGIYVTCGYTTYNCICDWYHWICL